jgi:hypothetical protein
MSIAKVILRQDCFGRWIIVHSENQELGWSGSQWVAIEPDTCLPAASVQVANCSTRPAAQEYAERFGFEVIVE